MFLNIYWVFFLKEVVVIDKEVIRDDVIALVHKPGLEYLSFEIKLIKTNEIVGKIVYRKYETDVLHTGNVGYEIKDEYQGQGIAKRALNLFLTVLKHYKIKRVYLAITQDNEASKSVALANGAYFNKLVGVPEYHLLYQRDHIKDVEQYVIDLEGERKL